MTEDKVQLYCFITFYIIMLISIQDIECHEANNNNKKLYRILNNKMLEKHQLINKENAKCFPKTS